MVLLGILTVLVLALSYVSVNLYRKVVKQESLLESQAATLKTVALTLTESRLYVDQLDEKGTLRSDDEIGTFFDFMKDIQKALEEAQS